MHDRSHRWNTSGRRRLGGRQRACAAAADRPGRPDRGRLRGRGLCACRGSRRWGPGRQAI